MEAAPKLLKDKGVNTKEVAYMRARAQQSAAAVADPPAQARGSASRLPTLWQTSEEIAAQHPEMPALLAQEMVVVVKSCPKRGVDPDLFDAHEAYAHVFEEHCQRCKRRVSLRRTELQRAGVLDKA